MQGIAGFFKSVIKPYTIPARTDNDETPSKTDAAETSTQLSSGSVTDSDQSRPEVKGPVKVDGMKTEVPTKTVIEHDNSLNDLREMVYDLIKDIKDPEKPNSLEELDVVAEQDVCVCKFSQESYLVQITFVPTVPHCSLASLIGLCLRQKLIQDFPEKHKLDIFIKEGTHETAEEVNKQINDKERIAAALENPNLRELVDQCISNDFG